MWDKHKHHVEINSTDDARDLIDIVRSRTSYFIQNCNGTATNYNHLNLTVESNRNFYNLAAYNLNYSGDIEIRVVAVQ